MQLLFDQSISGIFNRLKWRLCVIVVSFPVLRSYSASTHLTSHLIFNKKHLESKIEYDLIELNQQLWSSEIQNKGREQKHDLSYKYLMIPNALNRAQNNHSSCRSSLSDSVPSRINNDFRCSANLLFPEMRADSLKGIINQGFFEIRIIKQLSKNCRIQWVGFICCGKKVASVGGAGGRGRAWMFQKLILLINQRAMQKYKTIKTLGDGAFGTVYKATNTKTGEVVAIKKMKQKYTNWNECIELREIKSLRKLNHTNIIKLKEVLLVSDELYMVFEYLDYNLYEVYSKMKEEGKKFTEKEIKNIVYQIASGLASMHKNGFFHRDMKPENLLIYNNVVKLCDLGLAREIRSRPPFTDYVSTRWYRAPELLLRSTNYNSPVDIFALGCIMAELYTFCPLFPGTNEVDQLNKIVKILGTPDKADWPEGYKLAQSRNYYFSEEKGVSLGELIPDASMEAIDLIESMLQYSSRKRPTAAEILKHDFFKGVNVIVSESANKDLIFQEKPAGAKLDTQKQDKKIDVFRATKEKFKQTRKHDAMESNLFKQIDVIEQNKSAVGDGGGDDIDSILKYLEDKNKKKDPKLPLISTKEKFYKPPEKKELRESKTELKHGEFKYYDKDEWKNIKQNPQLYEEKEKNYYRNEDSSYKKYLSNPLNPIGSLNSIIPVSKKETIPQNKFSYSFQPAAIPQFIPSSKTGKTANLGLGLAYLPLPKPNSLLRQPLASLEKLKQ